jgi:hypothetical protein
MGMTYMYMCSMAVYRTLVASVGTLRIGSPSFVVSPPYEDIFLFRYYICYSAIKRTE